MLKNNKNYKWSKISNTRDMNRFYKINIKSKKKVFLKKLEQPIINFISHIYRFMV